jgi:hypothetical protein
MMTVSTRVRIPFDELELEFEEVFPASLDVASATPARTVHVSSSFIGHLLFPVPAASNEDVLSYTSHSSPHGDRCHRRAGGALNFQGLQDKCELIDLLLRRFVEFQMLQQVNAVDYESDLMHRQ